MAKAAKPKAHFAQPGRLELAEYVRVEWDYLVPEGDEYEMLLEPSYWAHMASKGVKPWNRIEVRDEQGRFYAELLVTSVGRNFIQVSELWKKDIENVVPVESLEPAQYEIKHLAFGKYRILRRSDGSVLKDNLDGKEAAQAYLRDHLKALAA